MDELYQNYLEFVKKKSDLLWKGFGREMEFAKETKREYRDFDLEIAEEVAWEKIGKKLQDIEVEATYRGCNVEDIKGIIWSAR